MHSESGGFTDVIRNLYMINWERYSWRLFVLDSNNDDMGVVCQYVDCFYKPMLELSSGVPPSNSAANLWWMVHRQYNQGLEVVRGCWLWSLKTRPAELGSSTIAILITLVRLHEGDEPSVSTKRP